MAQVFGALGPEFYGHLIGHGSDPSRLFIGHLIGRGVMVAGGLVELSSRPPGARFRRHLQVPNCGCGAPAI